MKSLKTLFLILISVLFFKTYSQETVDHNAWDQILILNVTDSGLVNYDGVTSDVVVFYKYFRYLQGISPEEHWTNQEKIAY